MGVVTGSGAVVKNYLGFLICSALVSGDICNMNNYKVIILSSIVAAIGKALLWLTRCFFVFWLCVFFCKFVSCTK